MTSRRGARTVLIATALLGGCAKPGSSEAPHNATIPSNGLAEAQPTDPIKASTYCARIAPQLQKLVVPEIELFSGSDSTDPLHQGEKPYVECDFRQNDTQLVVGLHDATSGTFNFDPQDSNYAPLAGFGDRARYTTRGAMGMRWVDVIKGNAACEVRLTLTDDQIRGDWKQTAGAMCNLAFASQQPG
ncbi:MAG TPA: hypothetical protein VF409_10455 [Sphingomonas sp.]